VSGCAGHQISFIDPLLPGLYNDLAPEGAVRDRRRAQRAARDQYPVGGVISPTSAIEARETGLFCFMFG
jgi:hypothetical protein